MLHRQPGSRRLFYSTPTTPFKAKREFIIFIWRNQKVRLVNLIFSQSYFKSVIPLSICADALVDSFVAISAIVVEKLIQSVVDESNFELCSVMKKLCIW